MKNILSLLIIILLGLFIIYDSQKTDIHKVFKVESPIQFYIDINSNYILDEKEPFIIKNLYYVNKETDYSKFKLLSDLSEEEKFFLEYKANFISKRLIKNKFVEIKENDIFIKGKSYTEQLLATNFFYNEDEQTQRNLLKAIKETNLDEYRIYNKHSKRIHKLSCEEGRKGYNYKIIHFSNISKKDILCSSCFKQEIENKIKNSFETDKIKIYFLDLNKIFKPSNSCETVACKSLLNEINNSKRTIDFAIYGINNQPKIVSALINAQKRGVKIRWICDYSKKHTKYYKHTEFLKKEIPTFKTDKNYENKNQSAIMHNKFFIFDDQKVWTGSANITSTDLSGFNANYAVLILDKSIAQKYKEEFNQMYNGLFHKEKETQQNKTISIDDKTNIKVLFSPQDKIITNEIIPLINKANKNIYSPIFFITNKDLATALIEAHKRGIEIKIINDATNSHSQHTMHKKLRENGIKVKTENFAGKMHMKAMFIDDKISIIGSMNFTKSGNNKNDENMLIIENREITEYLKNTFLHIWNKIPSRYEKIDPRAESLESIGSCFDGIDNNFDDKIDSKDIGCFQKN